MEDNRIGGTLIAYYYICKRKMYLYANNIRFENYNDQVKIGKNTHENHFQYKTFKEVDFNGSKFDFLKVKDEVIINEVKNSKALEDASIWQLKYYIYQLRNNGIDCSKGILHYPKIMRRLTVTFTEEDRRIIMETEKEIQKVINSELVPELKQKGYCKKCSYYEFCFV
jgi:CRISPR-associated exonuclease Cas4